MKKLVYSLILFSAMVSCSEDYKAQYDKKLSDYKKEKQELIKQKYNSLLSLKTKVDEINNVLPEGNHKNIKIEFENPNMSNKFNAIYLDYSFYDDSYPFKLENQDNINDIKNLIEDKELSLYDEASAVLSIDYLNNFIKYGNQFLEMNYAVIHVPLEVTMPKYEENGMYTMGEVTGLVSVFDISSQKLLDNFIYVNQSSESIEYVEDVSISTQDVLMSDFFSKINGLIRNELIKRYDMNIESFMPLLTENKTNE